MNCDSPEYTYMVVDGVDNVLAALEDKSTETKPVTAFAAGQNIFFCQPVTGSASVASADAAVIAVIFTVVGELDQPADIDMFSVYRLCRHSRLSLKFLDCLCIFCCKQTVQFAHRQHLLRLQALYDLFFMCLINLHSADAYTLE